MVYPRAGGDIARYFAVPADGNQVNGRFRPGNVKALHLGVGQTANYAGRAVLEDNDKASGEKFIEVLFRQNFGKGRV